MPGGRQSWASSPAARRTMQANRARDTKPEVALRSALWRAGLRFFKNRRPIGGRRCEVDIVFPSDRVAVQVDGCFWHGCPDHGTSPVANGDWWRAKLDRNRERDLANTLALQQAGWTVLRVWEHESVAFAVQEVQDILGQIRASRGEGPVKTRTRRPTDPAD